MLNRWTLSFVSLIVLALLSVTARPSAGPATAAPPTLTTLQPGGFRNINQANTILADIYASPRAGNAAAALTAADAHAASALTAYAGMDYAGAAARGKLAFGSVLAAAAQAGVHVEPQNYTADYKAKGRSPKFVDTVNDKRLAN
jgi:hypothetical protein